MFKKEDGSTPSNATIIAGGVKVEGDFASPGDVRIEGTVIGTVKADGDILITETAVIEADVTATSATVAGEIKGDLTLTEKLELLSSAKVRGNLSCRSLTVEVGAIIAGNCQVGVEKAAVEKVAATARREKTANATEA
jgi:cytoskeletal protein CcmA (bactofilin family)